VIPVLIIFLGVVLALILPIWIYPILIRLGIVDVPNERSSHQIPTVRGMGAALAIAGCITTGVLVAVDTDGYEKVLVLTLLGVTAAALGFVEDLRGIRVAKRAGLQILIGAGFGVLAVWATGAGWIWVPISAISVAAYINVANFMDGINGISGLHGGVTGISYAILGAVSDRLWMTHLALVVAGVFLAFLPWNLSGRHVFLGDVGSYFLGAWIAGIAALAVASGINPILAIGPTVVYLVDTGFTLVRRIRSGERWFEAHRSHIYQQLALPGGKHLPVALLVAGFSALTALASFLAVLPTWFASAGALVLMALISAVYLCLPKILRRRRRELSGDPA
jgi:UDP-N-acetylmuramyl pentapeptide phosphotransferase/UDP-N-acetylglucosamine-1-phosphate transferase